MTSYFKGTLILGENACEDQHQRSLLGIFPNVTGNKKDSQDFSGYTNERL